MNTFDVVAVNIKSNTVRLIANDKSLDDAEAIVELTFRRQGADEEFFAIAPNGVYQDGDIWRGKVGLA